MIGLFRWNAAAMVVRVNKKNPESVLETNIFRLNYDKKPHHICKAKKNLGKFSTKKSL